MQATKELETASASGLATIRYIGTPVPHWHTPLLLLHSAARSQWPQPLLERHDVTTLLRFARVCLARLRVAARGMRTASHGGGTSTDDSNLGTPPPPLLLYLLMTTC